MVRPEVRTPVALAQPFRHGTNDSAMGLVLDGPIATEDPNHRLIAVATAEPSSIGLGVLGSENLRTDTPLLVPLVAPRRQETDKHPQPLCFVHDVINVIPVIVPVPFVDRR